MKMIKKMIIVIAGIVLAGIYSFNTWSASIYDTNIDSSTYANVGELVGDATVEQRFLCEQNGLESVEVVMSNPGNESDAVYHWSVREVQTDKVIGEGYFNVDEVVNAGKKLFSFEKQQESKSKEYIFAIDIVDSSSEHGISVMKTAAGRGQEEGLSLNGEQEEEVLVLTQNIKYLNIETAIVFFGLYMYIVLFMTFLTKLFK